MYTLERVRVKGGSRVCNSFSKTGLMARPFCVGNLLRTVRPGSKSVGAENDQLKKDRGEKKKASETTKKTDQVVTSTKIIANLPIRVKQAHRGVEAILAANKRA